MTKVHTLTPEQAYILGYSRAVRGLAPNLRQWPGITRSRMLRACYEQGYETGLEQSYARRAAA